MSLASYRAAPPREKILAYLPALGSAAAVLDEVDGAELDEKLVADHEEEEVVQLTEDGDEVGDDIERHDEIKEQNPDQDFEYLRGPRVPVEQPQDLGALKQFSRDVQRFKPQGYSSSTSLSRYWP